MDWKNISIIIGAAVVLWGAFEYIPPRSYVDAQVTSVKTEISLVQLQLRQKILDDRIQNLKRDKRRIEEKYGTKDPFKITDEDDRSDWFKLNDDLERYQKEYDLLLKKLST